jgi:hypothetical protein
MFLHGYNLLAAKILAE